MVEVDTELKQTSSIHCFIRGVTTQPEVCRTHYKSKRKKGRRGERKKGERAERKETLFRDTWKRCAPRWDHRWRGLDNTRHFSN